jgi:hypothetical protein
LPGIRCPGPDRLRRHRFVPDRLSGADGVDGAAVAREEYVTDLRVRRGSRPHLPAGRVEQVDDVGSFGTCELAAVKADGRAVADAGEE